MDKKLNNGGETILNGNARHHSEFNEFCVLTKGI